MSIPSQHTQKKKSKWQQKPGESSLFFMLHALVCGSKRTFAILIKKDWFPRCWNLVPNLSKLWYTVKDIKQDLARVVAAECLLRYLANEGLWLPCNISVSICAPLPRAHRLPSFILSQSDTWTLRSALNLQRPTKDTIKAGGSASHFWTSLIQSAVIESLVNRASNTQICIFDTHAINNWEKKTDTGDAPIPIMTSFTKRDI